MDQNNFSNHWDEETSRRFLDYGRYFVPAREQQMQIMTNLLREMPTPGAILELGCGEGRIRGDGCVLFSRRACTVQRLEEGIRM